MSRPGRREQPPDLLPGPRADFLFELRKLRAEAGDPSYRLMSARSGTGNEMRSHTTLSELTTRPQLPTWETTAAYIRGLGRDADAWHERWRAARAQLDGATAPAQAPAIQAGTSDPQNAARAIDAAEPEAGAVADAKARVEPTSQETQLVPTGRRRRRPIAVITTAFVVLVVSTGAAAWFISRERHDDSVASATIIVQNKVATGPTTLAEDSTPAYLSRRTIPFCAKYKCAVPDTNMWSNARLTAVCQTPGSSMSNANEESEGISQNPHVAHSTRWYGVRRGDSSLAYLSEVYVRPEDRGSLHLPDCTALGG